MAMKRVGVEIGMQDFLTDSFILESLSHPSGLAQVGIPSRWLSIISLGLRTSSQFKMVSLFLYFLMIVD